MVLGRFLSADIFRVNSSASSARIRPYPRGVRRSPPNVRRTFGGVRRKIFLADVRRIRAEPGGVRAYPRGFARIRGGSSSAEPVAPYCWNYLDQTNCTDIERVGGYCEVNGYVWSISKYMVCNEYDRSAEAEIKLCDDNIQNVCIEFLHSACKIHRHKMCDEVKDCSDGSDEINDHCSTMMDKMISYVQEGFNLLKVTIKFQCRG